MNKSRKIKQIDSALWAFFIFSLGYQFLFYRHGINLWDEGVIYSGTERLLHGDVINRDFFGYQPGRYYLLALFFRWFGVSIETGRLMWIPLTSLMATVGLLVSRRLIQGPWVWLPPVLLLAAPAMYYNRFFPLFLVLNLYFLYRAVERMDYKGFAPSFLFGAFTFFFFVKRSVSSPCSWLPSSFSPLSPSYGKRGILPVSKRGSCPQKLSLFS